MALDPLSEEYQGDEANIDDVTLTLRDVVMMLVERRHSVENLCTFI